MDYSLILSELQEATLFDLYRLRTAIGTLLEDPERLRGIKRHLAPGKRLSYFDCNENRLVDACLIEVYKTRALVNEIATGENWTIPLFWINLQEVDTNIVPSRGNIDRNSLKVGDTVGFQDREGRDVYGAVTKLNPKRAKIKTPDGIWSVPYAMLFPVIEGEQGEGQLLPRAPN